MKTSNTAVKQLLITHRILQARATNTILPDCNLGNRLFCSCTVKGYKTGLQQSFWI